jgi:dTDP-4-dehydrorhamnose 3,5-epimerase
MTMKTGDALMAGRTMIDVNPHGGKPLIHEAQCKQLKVIPDERGRLMEMIRNDDPFFKKFGQAYLTAAYPGVVKGWHYHKVQWDHFVVVKGMMKIVLYDARDASPTSGVVNEFFMGDQRPAILQIPPYVYHGFKCISDQEAMVINFPTETFKYDDPDEFRAHPHENDIPYDWTRQDG